MIFLIGGNGFFGSAFATYLKKKNIKFKKITKKNYKKYINKFSEFLNQTHILLQTNLSFSPILYLN